MNSVGGTTFEVTNPFTKEVITEIANCDESDAHIVIEIFPCSLKLLRLF